MITLGQQIDRLIETYKTLHQDMLKDPDQFIDEDLDAIDRARQNFQQEISDTIRRYKVVAGWHKKA